MATRKTFEQEVGIDTGEDARPSTWDRFHEIEVGELRKSVASLMSYADEYCRLLADSRRRCDMWKLAAWLGWGMFAIAFVSRIL